MKRKIVKKKREQIRMRIAFLLAVMLFLLIAFGIGRVSWIKSVKGSEYENNSIANQMNKIQDKVISPNRGAILDRNNQSLAISSTVYNIALDVRILSQQDKAVQDETIKGLAELLGIDENEIRGYIQTNPETGKPNKDTNWFVLKKQVDFELGKKIKERNLKCVYAEEDTKRSYPHNSLAAQVIGFIRGDTMYGLESRYNSELVGTAGRIFRTYESDNSIVTREIDPEEGNTVVTTIDQTIQQFAENACKEAYEGCKPEHVPLNTSAVVMDPNTGEILAMAEYPTFDLNDPTKISLEEDSLYKETWENLSDEEKMNLTNTIWTNFNTTYTYEPGSIFKPIVIAAAYEEGIISPNDTFYCGGSKEYNGELIKCHLHSGHGTQTAEQVLANSCNVGMMEIASKLGKDKFYKYQRDFGFGERTGVDLPNEASAKELLYKLDDIHTVELATCSFGQGFNCTSIQAITAFAAAINGGNLMKPYVVSQVLDNKGNVVKETNPQVVRKVISGDTSDYLRKAMESVISSTGTGKKAQIDGYAIGGKTGTAQQGVRDDNIYTLNFISYFPVDDPQYICMVVINRPENYSDGIVSPAPYIKKLMQDIINYKNIPPSYESGETERSIDSETDVIIKDYTNKSLKETIQELITLGIDFELGGSSGNIVTKQRPEAGAKVSVGNSIFLFIGTDGDVKLTAVPDLQGLSVDEARELLTASGFECAIYDEEAALTENGETVSNEDNYENVEEGQEEDKVQTAADKKVYKQVPSAGSNVEAGTTVKIRIR